MKTKKIIFSTLSLIMIMTLTLCFGLSFIYASAIGEDPIKEESFLPENLVVSEKEQPNMHEKLDEGLIDNNEVTPNGDQLDIQAPSLGNEDRDYYTDCITIDIYEQATGKYVGQIIVDSEEHYSKLYELFYDYAMNRTETFKPNIETSQEKHWLPKSKYRIEVMAGSIFAYSYGVDNNTMIESLQSGCTFFGGEKVIEFIDSLVVDTIAKIENGNYTLPNEKTSIVEIEKLTLYWNGGYHDILGTFLPANNRLTPRFPYLITE